MHCYSTAQLNTLLLHMYIPLDHDNCFCTFHLQDGVTDTTPLHVACDRQNREIVELLLEAGANPSMCALSQSMNSLHTCAARGFLT